MIIIQFVWISFYVLVSLLVPQNIDMPVSGATKNDYNQNSYWAYPWGKSVVHKGVDIFAKKDTPVISATVGILISRGYSKVAGNYVLIMSPRLQMHYYAHLNTIEKTNSMFINRGQQIGTVGDTGNAKGKPYHLHYAIYTPIPYFWLADNSIMGWKKAYYINPIPLLND